MQQAHLPFNEAQRLKALRSSGLLDTPSDPRFEALTRAAAAALEVPIAAVTLVDEARTWNKAAAGLPFPKFQEGARALSFSAHAILEPGQPFVVEDASRDPRFADNPNVVGPPFIRFFAAMPLVDEAGLPFGTLGIADHVPRALTDKQLQELRQFGAQAELLILLHDSQHKLGSVAIRDTLTGLGNRRDFQAKLEHLVGQGRCGLLLIDIDDFGSINADFGLIAGDAVLCEAARRLVACVRPADEAFRLSGDQFAILMPGPFDAPAPEDLAKRILEDFERPFFQSGTKLSFGASVAVALCPEDAGTSTTLVRGAEKTLAAVRDNDGLKFARLRDEAGLAPSRRSLEWDLMRATENGEFELHWQPIVDLRDNSLHGYEAFLRWTRPQIGEVSPDRFLPVAERSGLLTNIDRWALREACRQAAAWTDPTRFAVNVSADWLGRRQLPEAVAEILADTGVSAARLEIDITEGLLNRDGEQAARDIKSLRDMGARIALDDFGIGMSSLSHLKDYPFDMIKLHRTFTADLRTNPRSAAVVEAVIALGRKLGITVSAEGVEELWHLEFLRERGCDLAQGYLFGRPAPEPRAPGLIDRPAALAVLTGERQSAA